MYGPLSGPRVSLHLGSSLYIRVPKYIFVPKVLAWKKCAKSFGTEFHTKILCRNSEPKILALCQNFRHEILAWNILAWNFGKSHFCPYRYEGVFALTHKMLDVCTECTFITCFFKVGVFCPVAFTPKHYHCFISSFALDGLQIIISTYTLHTNDSSLNFQFFLRIDGFTAHIFLITRNFIFATPCVSKPRLFNLYEKWH